MRKTASYRLLAVHEGKKIKELLDRHEKSVTDLRKASGVSWPAASKYTKPEVLGDKAWSTCSRGLMKLGIDPNEVRPLGHVSGGYKPLKTIKMLESWGRPNLIILKQVLDVIDSDFIAKREIDLYLRGVTKDWDAPEPPRKTATRYSADTLENIAKQKAADAEEQDLPPIVVEVPKPAPKDKVKHR